MADHGARVAGIVRDELKSLPFGGQFSYAVGHSWGTVPIQGDQVYVGTLWVITVSLRNPLVGEPDIAQSVPVAGPVPPDHIFRQATRMLAGACRKEHARALE